MRDPAMTKKTGRPPGPAATPPSDTVDHAQIDRSRIAVDVIGSATRGIEAGQIEFSQRVGARIGMRNTVRAMQKLCDVTGLIDLQQIKESKQYKDLRVSIDGKLVTSLTWKDYCEFVEGRSVEHVDEDLRNLKAFGADMLESFQQLGMGYRQMRDLRAIPPDSKVLLIEAARVGDQVKLLEAAEDLIERHSSEKTKLEKTVGDLGRKVADLNGVIKSKNQKNDELLEQMEAAARRHSGTASEREQAQLQALRETGAHAEVAVRQMMAAAVEVVAQPATEAAQLAAWQAVEFVAQVLAELISTNNMPVDFVDKVKPHWLREFTAPAAAPAAG